jgi:DNA-binding transcriptional regulator GbsR (MarR family)
MMKVYKFLGVENDINVNLNVKHNRGGRKWRNSFLKNLFIEDNFVKIFFKSILPKKIRRHIYRILSNFSKNNTKKINKETQMHLNNYFKDDIFELSKLINKDLEHWTR